MRKEIETVTLAEAARVAGVSKTLIHRWVHQEIAAGNAGIFEPGRAGSEETAGRVALDWVYQKRAERRRRVEREVKALDGRVTWEPGEGK